MRLQTHKWFDLVADWNWIEVSFFQVYNIDLTKQKISCRQFHMMLNMMPEEAPISKLINIRSYVPPLKDAKMEYNKKLNKILAAKAKLKLEIK